MRRPWWPWVEVEGRPSGRKRFDGRRSVGLSAQKSRKRESQSVPASQSQRHQLMRQPNILSDASRDSVSAVKDEMKRGRGTWYFIGRRRCERE